MADARQDEQETIVFHVAKSMQGGYVEVPFQLPESTAELAITMEYSRDDGATIDLGLRDTKIVRGWSGGARSELVVRANYATPGYLPGKLVAGGWAVILGTYQVPENGCDVTLSLRFKKNQRRWLKGDLHAHTVHSDGKYTFDEVVKLAEQAGLDFIGLTDHNTTSQNLSYPRGTEVTFIPAMELTTYKGHCNFFGVVQPVDDFRATDEKTVAALIHTAKQRGAYVALNHPYDTSCPSCNWQWSWDVEYDWVEVWNGPWRSYNQDTVNWWHGELVKGRRLTAVGGSDAHRPHPYVHHGVPTTWVASAEASAEAILQAIHQGHAFMTYDVDGPRVNLTIGDYIVGDVVPASVNAPVALVIDDLQAGDVIKVYTENGVFLEHTANSSSWAQTWQNTEHHAFYRAEVWRYFKEADGELMAALTNPIYCEV